MLTTVHPKLPMRDKAATRAYYEALGFQSVGSADYEDYLMVKRDNVEIHFFAFEGLDPLQNDGQVYIRTDAIDELYKSFLDNGIAIHPAGHLETKPWGQREISLRDPDHNLLTIGQER